MSTYPDYYHRQWLHANAEEKADMDERSWRDSRPYSTRQNYRYNPSARAGSSSTGRYPRRKPASPPRKNRPTGKIALAVISILVLGVTWYGWTQFRNFTTGYSTANVIDQQNSGPKPADGSTDILLVGMDSRTDAQGNPLPKDVLNQLHAGDASDGGYNTDTMILIHIPNDGSKASAISIPRDSYVDIANGYGAHKINSAFAYGRNAAAKQLSGQGVTGADLENRANQEGAKTAIQTVENLTGITIDHYAQVNLAGFYDITKVIGGVQVCLKNPVNDSYSGANFPAGKQTIDGAAALAFVRQRHGLPNGDLDRIKRQQVFMAGLAQNVLSAGTLVNPAKLGALADAVKKSVVLDQGWDILGFAQQMHNLTGGELQFATIPIVNISYQTPEDGDAIQIDPMQVRTFVQGMAKPSTAASASTTDAGYGNIKVDVRNATNNSGLASRVLGRLVAMGFGQGNIGTVSSRTTSLISYPTGGADNAKKVADALGGMATTQDAGLTPGQIEVYLGSDYSGPGVTTNGTSTSQSETGPTQTTTTPPPITADGVTCVN